MKGRYSLALIGVSGIIVAIVVLMMFHQDKNNYTNFFEYAVTLENKDWTYAPAQLEFGMTMEEVLQAEGLDETAILEDDSEVVFVRKTLGKVSENIGQVEFLKRFIVAESYGLVGTEYQLLVAESDFEEVCGMLYEQAVSYMPEDEQVSVAGIKDGKGVLWRSYDEGNNLKCCVSFSTDAVYEADRSKRIISLSVYIEPSYLKKLIL